MAATVLSLSEQKLSLSAKKKKKKSVKNVLGLPSSVKVESVSIKENESEKLNALLEMLLPAARIPSKENQNDEKEKEKKVPENIEILEKAKNKRKQLALGVNDLNRSIKKNSIAAVILSNDIHPKFLIHHINLLCTYNEIPFLHVPGLREITQKTLGFPCIALGFRKNFDDFREAVNLIKAFANSRKVAIKSIMSDSESSDHEEEDEEICTDSNQSNIDEEKSLKVSQSSPFKYLYRSSNKERVFIPENYYNGEIIEMKAENEFIPLGELNESCFEENDNLPKAISNNVIKQSTKKKKRKKNSYNQLQNSNLEVANDEYFEVPKKKSKLSGATDKFEKKKNFKYSPANIIKFHSNENRISKNINK